MFHVELSTLIFQVVNFLVLLTVLTHFFFRPLRQTMRRREEAIASRLRQAEEQSKQADAERARLAEERQRAQAEAAAALTQTRAAAAKERERILAQTREDVARLRAEAAQRIAEEERLAELRLVADVRETALTIAGSLVRETAGLEVHRALVARCFDPLHPFGGDRGAVVRQALGNANGTIAIETAYPLTNAQTERLRQTVAAVTGRDAHGLAVDVRIDPTLLAGVRLVVGTAAIDASLRHALQTLDGQTGRRADGQDSPVGA